MILVSLFGNYISNFRRQNVGPNDRKITFCEQNMNN